MRVIAILDYWTQVALKPLHDALFTILKTFRNDGTFDQDRVKDTVSGWVRDPNRSVYSYDLTAATDRLPLWFQVEVLNYLLGSRDAAEAWAGLMSDRSFRIPEGGEVRYSVGQPMGALSSFAMLSLTHHILVQISAILVKRRAFKDYVILGDDNTIADGIVALSYLGVMESLGLSISLYKSHYSLKGARSAGELCKRLYVDTIELTALPVKLIVKAHLYPGMGPDLQAELQSRGFDFKGDELNLFLSSILPLYERSKLILLNSFPSEVSGIPNPIREGKGFIPTKDLFPSLALSEDDLISGFMYFTILRQLKDVNKVRLHALRDSDVLSSSSLVSLAIRGKMPVLHDPRILTMPTLTGHPVNLAWWFPATYEVERQLDSTLTLLENLRVPSELVLNRLRKGMLVLATNSFSELVSGSQVTRRNVERTMINELLDLLLHMSLPGSSKEVSTSILLADTNVNWKVKWVLGSRPVVSPGKMPIHLALEATRARLHDVVTTLDPSSHSFSVTQSGRDLLGRSR